MIGAPIYNYAIGFTISMGLGAALLCMGEKGHRHALPNAIMHIHTKDGGTKSYTEDVRILTREQERLQVQLFHAHRTFMKRARRLFLT